MSANRFKIDIYDSSYAPFGLYVLVPGTTWRPGRWKLLNHFPTRDEARALHETVKDLPEYLS